MVVCSDVHWVLPPLLSALVLQILCKADCQGLSLRDTAPSTAEILAPFWKKRGREGGREGGRERKRRIKKRGRGGKEMKRGRDGGKEGEKIKREVRKEEETRVS